MLEVISENTNIFVVLQPYMSLDWWFVFNLKLLSLNDMTIRGKGNGSYLYVVYL